MAGELERALGSIDLSLNKKEDKYAELATLQSFDKQRENDSLKEQQAEIQYQKYEEQVNLFSSSLLKNDRDSIRKVHKEGKEFLRESLIANGGSYKKFMANGGLRVLGNYKAGIISSDEANRYKSNSQNMAKIIAARDSGKGHNISSIDKFNLKKYETEGGGEITYSGLLSDIEPVDQNAYELGTKITGEMMLDQGNNNAIIMGNYMRENPDKGPPNRRQLVKYANEKYDSIGKNQAMLQYANRKNVKAKKQNVLLYTSTQQEVRNLNTNSDNSKGFRVNLDSKGFKDYYQKGPNANSKIFSNRQFTDVSETERNSDFFSMTTWGNDTDNTRPKNSYHLSSFDNAFGKAAESIYKKYRSEDGRYKIPSSLLHGADGTPLNIDNDDDISLVPMTVIMAPTAKGVNALSNDKNETEFMIIEYSDEKGNLDEVNNKRYLEEIKTKNGDALNAEYRPWQVFKGKDGKLFYKRLDLNNISFEKSWTGAIKGENDYTKEAESSKDAQKQQLKIKVEQAYRDKGVKQAMTQVYQDPNFASSVYDSIIVEHQVGNNPDIFKSMIIGSAMGHNQLTGNESNKIQIIPSSLSGLAKRFSKNMPQSALEGLRNNDLSFEDAYIAMKNGMTDEAKNEQDITERDLFLENWKTTYEQTTNKKVNFKTKK